MATILSALRLGIIEEYRLSEHEAREPRRPLYLASEFFDWVEETDELYDVGWSPRSGGRSRFEHLQQMLADFRCDQRPLVGDLNRVMPTRQGVWKMQCAALRLYGWVPARHSFVGVKAAFSEHVHGKGSQTDQIVEDVLAFARRHDLLRTMNRGDRIALFQP